ncbi:MAG: hypothetical protein M1816_007139 [Peltula sp. TS41687]|nr:MAG: hypothetical protein M1816_007139 [Peltula sp. TS41687]
MPLGVAIIGSAPRLALRAIYSRSLTSATSLAAGIDGIDLYADDAGAGKTYDHLLKRSDIQAVVIVYVVCEASISCMHHLPILIQPTFIKAALAAGKHVLSEKPIAADVASAQALIDWYRSNIEPHKSSWSVAENYRFMNRFLHASEEVKKLGRILGVRVVRLSKIEPGGKYIETAWRKTPAYQGGFLLDGGIHFVAATRLLLGDADPIVRVSAQTTQLQPYLPPVDTLDAVLKLKSGVTGSFSVSFGTTLSQSSYLVACEEGVVEVTEDGVIVKGGEDEDAEETHESFISDSRGVKEEIEAWAESFESGMQDPRQSPDEALRDLEILEKMLRSGEYNGTPQEIVL